MRRPPPTRRRSRRAASPAPAPDADVRVQVAVLGAGPGGYTAAFRAADLGLQVALIDRGETLGGVCLNVGCIPSKALLHVARVLAESEELGASGVSFARPEIDIDALRGWKESVVGRLTGGLDGLARQRKVQVDPRRRAASPGPNVITVQTGDGETTVGFEHCIVAAGSSPAWLPDLPDDERVMDSTGALEVADVPERLLVIGGGIIGLEMATVYDALGSRVTVVELMDQLIPGCDPDLVKPLHKRIAARYEAIHLGVRVDAVTAGDDGLTVSFAGRAPPSPRPSTASSSRSGGGPTAPAIGAEAAGVEVDERGFIAVDRQMRTNVRPRLRHRRRRGRADARPQGDARGQGGGRGHRRRERPMGRALDPERRLYRPGDRLDRAHRDAGAGRGHRVREGRRSRGRPRGARWPRAATTA